MAFNRAALPAGSAAVRAPAAPRSAAAEPAPEFPGCRPVRIPRDAIDDYDGRFEYWDSATETAWVVREPTTIYHESPGQQLAGLLTRIAAVRGAPIVTVMDGHPRSLAWIGSALKSPVIPVGVTEFGQSGSRQDLYGEYRMDAESIAAACYAALETA